jgi:sugar phosphate isomerase/epimerase
MSTDKILFSVFTKPWKMDLAELGEFVSGLGFDAVELPVRPGFQVEPENVTRGLPAAVRRLAGCGVQIASIAGPTDEATIATCAQEGILIIRVCLCMDAGEDYMAFEARLRRELDALVPLLDRYGVTLGVQNHCGRCVTSAMALRHLIEGYDPRTIAAVWDPAHCALDGERPDLAADILWSHLCMVNLKNALWRRVNGPEAEYAEWALYWTSGRQGLASWPAVVAELKARDYAGVVCLTAEYSDHASVDRLIAEDIAFAKALFAEGGK